MEVYYSIIMINGNYAIIVYDVEIKKKEHSLHV